MFTVIKTHRICEGYNGELICVHVHVLWCACASVVVCVDVCMSLCACVCVCACHRSSQDFKNGGGLNAESKLTHAFSIIMPT